MSIAGITTLGFGTYATVNQAVVLGFFSGVVPPTPTVSTSVPGPADKRKRDRDEYFKRRNLRRKQARELKAKQPQIREEQVVVERKEKVAPTKVLYLFPPPKPLPPKQVFEALAAPAMEVPKGVPFPDLPPVPPPPKDDEDMFLLME